MALKTTSFVGLVLYVFHVSGRRRLEDVAFEASGLPISGWSAPALWIGYIPMFNGQLLTFTTYMFNVQWSTMLHIPKDPHGWWQTFPSWRPHPDYIHQFCW